MGNNRREETPQVLDDAFEIPPDAKPATGPEKKPCPECGKVLTWLQDGSRPRAHKCEPKEETQVHPTEQPQAPTGVTVDMVINAYVKTRDDIAAEKKIFDNKVADLKQTQEKREKWLQGEMQKLGVDSFKAEHGTCFTKWTESATVSDGEAFMDWVFADVEKRKHFLENRVSKAAVKQRHEDKKVSPPGVNFSRFKKVQIRRA